MTDTTTATTLERVDSLFSASEQLALAGFLAGYSSLTRDAYALDLRQFVVWCPEHCLALFAVRRADMESHAAGLDRNELGAMLVVAGLGQHQEHALVSLLALNGLRISEALGARIGDLGIERGHRTLLVRRKGGKVVRIPLAPWTARAVDLAVGERNEGPIFVAVSGQPLDRHCAAHIVRRVARTAGITKRVTPQRCATPSSPPSTQAFRCATSRRRRATPTRGRPCATTAPASPSTATPPTSSPLSWRAPLGSRSSGPEFCAPARRARGIL